MVYTCRVNDSSKDFVHSISEISQNSEVDFTFICTSTCYHLSLPLKESDLVGEIKKRK